MTLSELMEGKTPSTTFSGVATNDDFVLAVDISDAGDSEVGEYAVVQVGITGVNPTFSAETSDKTYIRAGKTTTKTATQRSFAVSGDRMIGDEFQDFAMSHTVKFGVGQTVIKPYVYFSILTGKGEKGTASIIINSDGSGDAGATAAIDVNITTVETPVEYTWSAVGV